MAFSSATADGIPVQVSISDIVTIDRVIYMSNAYLVFFCMPLEKLACIYSAMGATVSNYCYNILMTGLARTHRCIMKGAPNVWWSRRTCRESAG